MIFAVGEDGRSLLTRPIYGDEAWQVLARNLPVERIAGLAYDDDCLFFSDAGRPALWRLRLTTRSLDPVYEGFPLASTGELAIVDETEHLYVADVEQGRVYQLEADEKEDQDAPPRLIDLPKLKGPIYLAGSERDLVLTVPEPGAVYYLEREGAPFPIQYSTRLFINISVEHRPESKTSTPFRIASRAPRKIDRPGPVALYGGLIYVLNEGSGQTLVFSRHQPRPIYYPQKIRGPAPSRFVATADHLVRLNANGDSSLQAWSRLIPAEVEFPAENATAAMTAIYSYLSARDLLPTRAVPVGKNLETTLKREKVLLEADVSELDPLLCKLNEPLCAGGRIRPLEEGQLIAIPDLYSESTIDVAEVKLDGRTTLAQELDRRIHNSEFAVWKEEEAIVRLNSGFTSADGRNILEQSLGHFSIPVELMQYVIGFPAREMGPESSQLGLLRKQFPGINLLPLQESRSRPNSLQASNPAARWAEAGTAYQALLGTIHFSNIVMEGVKAAQIKTTSVGVAEGRIAEDHPAFQNDENTPAFESISSYWPNVAIPPADPVPANVPDRLRDFRDDDHGTSVASLIGARKLEFGGTGIAPRAILVSLFQEEPYIRDEIQRAAIQGVKLFNISHSWENEVPQGLYEAIRAYKNYLFVVSAGQNSSEGERICEPFMIYPACWSSRRNVLVVAGTTLDGGMLFPGDDNFPGSNYGRELVHVAAPGVGYYAAGWSASYVPIRGTSFATPLVTATAALLHEQGVNSAFKIKQRIIATADDKATLRDRILGGLLNIERAATRPYNGQVVNDNYQRSFIEVRASGEVRIVRPDEEEGTQQVDTIAVPNLLRVSRSDDGYRVVYVVNDQIKVVHGAEPEPPNVWNIQYYNVNSQGVRMGQIKTLDLSTVQDYIAPVF